MECKSLYLLSSIIYSILTALEPLYWECSALQRLPPVQLEVLFVVFFASFASFLLALLPKLHLFVYVFIILFKCPESTE